MTREYKFVKSSNVLGVAYDAETRALHVQFISGPEYTYHDVPEDEYQNLIDDPSPGSFLNNNIKGTYRYTRG